MPDNAAPSFTFVPTTDVMELAKIVLAGEWIAGDDKNATEFFETLRKVHSLIGMLRQRADEQLDSAHNVGKFAKIERIRKARTTDEGPKVDPLAEMLGTFKV